MSREKGKDKMFKQQLNQQKSELLLAAVILARSTSFVLSKTAMNSLTPFNLLAVRFLTAFAFLAILFGKKLVRIQKTELKYGFLLGGILGGFLGLILQGMTDYIWHDYSIVLLFWIVLGVGAATVKMGVRLNEKAESNSHNNR